LKTLEKYSYKLTARRSDSEESLEVIRVLLPLYKQKTPDQIAALLDDFYLSHEETAQSVYDGAEELPERSAYQYQPEAPMMYDLLESDPAPIRKQWSASFPERDLERIANSFGI
jgi:hypothetical protein